MRRTAVLIVVFLVAAMSPASAATKNIEAVSGEPAKWMPSTVSGLPGDVVNWTSDGGFHNVSSATGMFRSGEPDFGEYSRTFSAGTFGFMCEVHVEMQGSVRIKPRVAAAPDGLPFTVRWATDATNTGTTFRVEYKVGSGDWRLWKSATTSKAGVFGKGGSPVTVRADRDYRFKVRSMIGTKRSAFSPIAQFPN